MSNPRDDPTLAILAMITVMGFYLSHIGEPWKARGGTIALSFNTQIRWCDRYGWAAMSAAQCMAMTIDKDSIPLPSAGTCPGAYELWIYDKRKSPICVRRA